MVLQKHKLTLHEVDHDLHATSIKSRSPRLQLIPRHEINPATNYFVKTFAKALHV